MKWYAVVMDETDNDLGTGSHDLAEAMLMAKDMNAKQIVIVEEGADPVAIDIIDVEKKEA